MAIDAYRSKRPLRVGAGALLELVCGTTNNGAEGSAVISAQQRMMSGVDNALARMWLKAVGCGLLVKTGLGARP